MDNLINFDENENKNEKSKEPLKNPKTPQKNPFLIKDQSFELNNPFDCLQYRVTHSDDPFECLEMINTANSEKSSDQITGDELGSFFSSAINTKKDVLNSTDPSPATSTTSSFIATDTDSSSSSKNKTLKRCQSDSSTSSQSECGASRYSSVDNILSSKTNQLLKLSLLNSPHSPLHSSSRTALDGSLIESVCLEAKKISEKLSSFNEMSFEDLNNISTQLVDSSNISDADLEQLKISFLEHNPEKSTTDPSTSEKIEDIQEKLRKIKKEEVVTSEEVIEIKEEKPQSSKSDKSDKEFDEIFQKIKALMKDNKKDEAKKHIQKLNDLLTAPDNKMLQVQPMVRQDTFEIDHSTGRRKYMNKSTDESDISSNGELMEQLAKLFGAQSLDVGSLNVSNNGNSETKFVVIMPKITTPAATPVKQTNSSRRSVSFSAQRPNATLKGIENKKLSTPMKPSTAITSNAVRRSSFTAPRQVSKQLHPYEQKLNIGTVRKSLMPSMDKSPAKPSVSPRAKNSTASRPPILPPPSNVRRSVSLKNNLPSVKISEPSPTKSRPTTTASSRLAGSNVNSRVSSATRRLSTLPSRPVTTDQKPLLTANRNNRKTEFKAPMSKQKISSSKESLV